MRELFRWCLSQYYSVADKQSSHVKWALAAWHKSALAVLEAAHLQ